MIIVVADVEFMEDYYAKDCLHFLSSSSYLSLVIVTNHSSSPADERRVGVVVIGRGGRGSRKGKVERIMMMMSLRWECVESVRLLIVK